MDKVKIVLDFFKKYLFWFISAATVVVVLICWWMSTASLATSFQQQQSAIKKKIEQVEAIVGDTQHPTPEYIKAVTDKHEKLKEGVLAVWNTLYNEQKAKNPWPQMLGDDFIQKINKLGPSDTIPYDLRERYQNRIKEYFPVLFKIIDLRQPANTAETGGRGGDNAESPPPAARANSLFRFGRASGGPTRAVAENSDSVGVVDWDVIDRLRLEDRFDWKIRPDSELIRLRQEDLWVYETLLWVIRKTNERATEQSQANVKRIEWIQIGDDAIRAWSAADQSVFQVQNQAVSAGGDRGQPDTKGAPPRRETAGPESKEQLLKDRYVDDKGSLLDAEANHPYAEFKMMPISMKLHMDQRKISKLLVECANSSMPIEVRRVRIRPGEGEILDAATQENANPTGTDRGETYRRPGGGRIPSRSTIIGGGSEESEFGPFDIPVEIQGIIYIYNPPDLNTLGTGTAAEKPAEGAPATEGAAGAPAAAP